MTLEKEIMNWVKQDLVVKQFCEDKQNNNLFANRIIGLTITKTQSKFISIIDKLKIDDEFHEYYKEDILPKDDHLVRILDKIIEILKRQSE
jgi:hypothetical protein